MTDTQAINASVLADWLECVKQMRNSFKAYKATLAADDTKKGFVSMLEIRMESATPDLDALRALVAEQEQQEQVNEDWEQEKINCGMRWGEKQEQADGGLQVPGVFMTTKDPNSPQFAVGDTVMIHGQPCRVSGYDDLFGKTGDVVELGDITNRHPTEVMVCGDDFEWWFYKEDLTLVSKAVTQ